MFGRKDICHLEKRYMPFGEKIYAIWEKEIRQKMWMRIENVGDKKICLGD